MKFFWIIVWATLIDNVAYFSVPESIRLQNHWALAPLCGGIILASAYHFGNKLNPPNTTGERK